LIAEISGNFGDFNVRTTKDGEFLIRRRMKRKGPANEAQLRQQKQFAEAAAYARAALADPVKRMLYEPAAARKKTSAFNLAMRDKLLPPTIVSINLGCYSGKKGDRIVILASDDFGIERISLEIRNQAGELLEQGELRGGIEYMARQDLAPDQLVLVEAAAFDHAGNKGTKTITYAVPMRSPECGACSESSAIANPPLTQQSRLTAHGSPLTDQMNMNHIRTDTFSNPATAKLFDQKWSIDRFEVEFKEQHRCEFCRHAHRLDRGSIPRWMLCLNPESHYYLETLSLRFSCDQVRPARGARPTRQKAQAAPAQPVKPPPPREFPQTSPQAS
jgi:hypothetical protein